MTNSPTSLTGNTYLRIAPVVIVALLCSPVSATAQQNAGVVAPCNVGDRFTAKGLEGVVRDVWPDEIRVQPDGAEPYDVVGVPLPFGSGRYVWPSEYEPAYGTAKPTPRPSAANATPDAAAICIPEPVIAKPQPIPGPGIRLLTQELLLEAITATEEHAVTASSLFLVQLEEASRSDAFSTTVALWEKAPFDVSISSPWVRAASAAAEARRKYQPEPKLSLDDLNQQGLLIVVRPGKSLTTADAIENVVIKRGDEIIRPIEATMAPETTVNALGAKLEVSRGTFRFAMEALAPSSAVTIVCVGAKGNYEITLTAMQLSRLR